MPGILISYRHQDSASHARRLFDRLEQHFGADRVFVNTVGIRAEIESLESVEPALASCDVLIVMIGRGWLIAEDVAGNRKLDNPRDPLRVQIAIALRRNFLVIPVLIEAAEMPAAESLPEDLQPLARRVAFMLSDTRWDFDVQHLIGTLEKVVARQVEAGAPPTSPPPQPASAPGSAGVWSKLKRFFRPRGYADDEVDHVSPTKRGRAESPPIDDVKLGAAAPESASPGQEFIAHFVAYPAHQENETRKILAAQSPDVTPVLGKRSCRWAQGTVVKTSVRGDYLHIEHPEQSFTWNGAIESLDFSGKVAADAPTGNVVLKYEVFVADFLVAALCLTVRVSLKTRPDQQVTALAYAPRTAFASYSSEDRSLVTHMVGAIERAAGIEVFQDCLDLRASEEWKPRLNQEIRARDCFMLFWSPAAAASTWVEWEWKTALRDKGKEAMQIHPLQPDLVPPDALGDLHFGSIHAIVADYYAKQSHAKADSPTQKGRVRGKAF